MNLEVASESTGAQDLEVRLTLSSAEAERLRLTLPWLLRALADRPTTSPGLQQRRRKAHAALEGLLNALSGERQPVEDRARTES